MKESINISVVIPLYNKEKAIACTVESVLKQTKPDFELIIVNDGSTDNSLAVAQQLALQDSRLRIIDKPNGGVSSARNTGIKAASGEYIALLDGDDTWDPTFLEEQVRLIEDFPKAGLWGVNYAFVRSGIPYPCQQGMGAGFRGYVENYFGTKHNDLFCSSSVMIRKNVFEQVGYFDERIAASEDLDMWFRIILHFPIVYYDKVLVYYQQDAENRVAYDTGVRVPLTRDIRYYIEKFDADCDANPTFAHYLHTYVAVHLLRKEYYFGTAKERKDSDVVVRKLRYEDIHPKYSWIFKTPRWFGRIVYKIVCMKKKVL